MTKGIIIAKNVFLGISGMFAIIVLLTLIEFLEGGAQEDFLAALFTFIWLNIKVECHSLKGG